MNPTINPIIEQKIQNSKGKVYKPGSNTQKIDKEIHSLNGFKTPFIAIKKTSIENNYLRIKSSIDKVQVYYAVKANFSKKIVDILFKSGSGFEVGSVNELKLLKSLGVQSNKVISSNPIKDERFLKQAYAFGLRHFVFDSIEEIKKIAKHCPESKVLLRLIVDNSKSQWPLSKKFGIEEKDAIKLIKWAKDHGLIPYGLTFHVGSQCLDSKSWNNALSVCRRVWQNAEDQGIRLKMINLGGGIPISYTKKVPSIEQIGLQINKSIDEFFNQKPSLAVEPGRALVGDAGILVSSIIGRAKRNGKTWLYLDAGVFNGFMETISGIKYSVVSEKTGSEIGYVLSGPTCDSLDTMFECHLPNGLEIGDRLYFINTGAYTSAYSSGFNGCLTPTEVILV